jgi:hypothetical protein
MHPPITDPHTAILETYFFDYIDRRIGADETPLFTLTFHGEALSVVVVREFQLSPQEADAALEAARQEVWL